ncbi:MULTISPECIES: GNAT family N-acetyltransferase [unclassified Pseudomonas]|uniref:GNAT family N-acetyltransferase n=1 Tax=unclassified Pseudomonas TaxID=196821 RepID=UPI00244AD196|nr:MULTISPECIES: GNAT family N-acetyltransferase [unclassified Pseudomonas]MDG9926017.1 GNAT family N-acetyltransferase [Pseudomonas sp. GD04045]MDH0033597.1 GNAT family N-acetyltransferase [Pseudomonas sp. GD04019]
MTLAIQRLAAADFERYRAGLIRLLLDAVAHDASVGFLADLDAAEASAYFDQVLVGLRDGSQLLWVAQDNSQVLGSVQLALCQKRNGLNRGEVQKLLVHSSARRRGIARALMLHLEREAAALKRGLLYLDTEAGSEAEPFYQALGYTGIGGLPDYACGPDGTYRANAIYYKTLSRPQP